MCACVKWMKEKKKERKCDKEQKTWGRKKWEEQKRGMGSEWRRGWLEGKEEKMKNKGPIQFTSKSRRAAYTASTGEWFAVAFSIATLWLWNKSEKVKTGYTVIMLQGQTKGPCFPFPAPKKGVKREHSFSFAHPHTLSLTHNPHLIMIPFFHP